MSGDTTKAGRWLTCDVWKAPMGTTFPADPYTDPDGAFELVGYMDGGAGVVKALDADSSILKGWGGTPMESVYTFNGENFTFTSIEDNDVVFGIVYAGSAAPTVTGSKTERTAKVPNPQDSAWLIRLSRANGNRKDYQIPKGKGRLSADVTENETDLGGSAITVDVLGNSSDELHDEVYVDVSGAWITATPYVVGDFITLASAVLSCTTAGTSGATAPVVPAKGATVTDGTTLVWTRVA